jgi:23S rRNA (adenine2030-N6)-methyltransferase
MNYRHAFHAGNAADVFKHLMLTRILAHLLKKDSALRYIDTHAGLGLYPLAGREAMRTGEALNGVARFNKAKPADRSIEALLAPYRALIAAADEGGRYPGSPFIAAQMLRPQDRLSLAELHPEDGPVLRRHFTRDRRVTVLCQDGYQMLNAATPPPERRGLVLIDPPFERNDDFQVLRDSLQKALSKWPTGCYAIWYPLKDEDLVERFRAALLAMGIPKLLDLVLWQDRSRVLPGLPGSGLLVINAPFTLADEARLILPWLADILATEHPLHGVYVLAES